MLLSKGKNGRTPESSKINFLTPGKISSIASKYNLFLVTSGEDSYPSKIALKPSASPLALAILPSLKPCAASVIFAASPIALGIRSA